MHAGLRRCGKSCRLRWLNYLRPNIKRGNISYDEEDLIIRLHKLLGNRSVGFLYMHELTTSIICYKYIHPCSGLLVSAVRVSSCFSIPLRTCTLAGGR